MLQGAHRFEHGHNNIHTHIHTYIHTHTTTTTSIVKSKPCYRAHTASSVDKITYILTYSHTYIHAAITTSIVKREPCYRVHIASSVGTHSSMLAKRLPRNITSNLAGNLSMCKVCA